MVEQLIRFCSLSLLLLLVWEEPIWTVDTTYINLTYIKFYLGISRWRFPNIVCFLGCLFVSLTPTNSVEKMIPFFEKKNTHFFFRMGFGWKPPTFSTWSLSLSLQAEDLGRQYRFPEKSPNNWSMSSKTTCDPSSKLRQMEQKNVYQTSPNPEVWVVYTFMRCTVWSLLVPFFLRIRLANVDVCPDREYDSRCEDQGKRNKRLRLI